MRRGVPKVTWPLAAFLLLALLTLYSGYRVATASLITHAALWLAATFAGVAGFFFFLQADFLAAVQLLIYAGAVMTVVVFAIMLSELGELGEGTRHQGLWGALASPRLGVLPLAASALLFVVLLLVYLRAHTALPAGPSLPPSDSTQAIAHALFGTYALPFEVASVLLLAALVGAILLTRREGADRS